MEFFLCVIGMVMIVEGTPYFAFPERMKQVVAQVLQLPDRVLRQFGFFLMLVGVLLVWLGKQAG